MTSRNIFVISDTHFGHQNMYKFVEADGFPVRRRADNTHMDMSEGDELIIENWNKTVKDNDIVYHLGDVYFGQGWSHIYRLKGRKRLILGNHDHGHDKRLLENFEKILVWRMFPEFECVLTHVPIHESAFRGPKTKWNFHGHIHRKPNISPVHLNCSVECMDYTPKSVEELRDMMKHV